MDECMGDGCTNEPMREDGYMDEPMRDGCMDEHMEDGCMD